MSSSPATGGLAVTPSDSADVTNGRARSLYIGGAGDVTVVFARGSAPVTHVGVPAGTVLPVEVTRVMVTGTTATNIVAWY
jgi:metal-dependent HD superfamily phosphatase/phosphodiesterase